MNSRTHLIITVPVLNTRQTSNKSKYKFIFVKNKEYNSTGFS